MFMCFGDVPTKTIVVRLTSQIQRKDNNLKVIINVIKKF